MRWPLLAGKPNLRVLATGALNRDADEAGGQFELRSVTGGLLVQQRDLARIDAAD